MNENPQESPSEERPRSKWGCARVLGALLVTVGILLWQPIQSARQSAWRASCLGSLKFIAMAMLNYEAKYGSFPPAYIADKTGRPMHSWRVLILPYLGDEEFTRRYRFDEPWNSPHNRALAHDVPHGMNPNYPMYHCPADRDSDKWDTSYVMIVGPGMVSNGPTSRSLADISNGFGSSRTLMIVEMSESGIHWMEPRDLNMHEMTFKINDSDGKGIRSKHPGGAIIVFCDGAERIIRETADPELVKDLITGKWNERVERFLHF